MNPYFRPHSEMKIDISSNRKPILDSIDDPDLKKKLPDILDKTFPVVFTGLINKYGFGNSSDYYSLHLQSIIPDLTVIINGFELTHGETEL